ncbi:DUF4376 domain-containing protein [Massilia sp. W12]|uniref:DUF4376 domain-containing protein n=1 Tax=Massilia sp. W12 TaxID=3126507 RepID=UPI0030D266CB
MGWLVIGREGEIIQGIAQDVKPEQCKCLQVDDDIALNWFNYTISEGKPIKKADAEITIAKSRKMSEIANWYAAKNFTYFSHRGKKIQCDPVSRSNIDAIATMLALGKYADNDKLPAGVESWRALDNTELPIASVRDFREMYTSMVEAGKNNFDMMRAAKNRCDQAESIDEISSITLGGVNHDN